jgi:hypothetical protein
MAGRRRTTAQEPAPATVLIEWTRSTGDAASEGGCNISDRHNSGRAGERVAMRSDDAAHLVAGGFVRRVAGEPTA